MGKTVNLILRVFHTIIKVVKMGKKETRIFPNHSQFKMKTIFYNELNTKALWGEGGEKKLE